MKIGNKIKKKINFKDSILFFIKIVHADIVVWNKTSCVRLSQQKILS